MAKFKKGEIKESYNTIFENYYGLQIPLPSIIQNREQKVGYYCLFHA